MRKTKAVQLPVLPCSGCSKFYYTCVKENGRAIWNYTSCPGEEVFSPNIGIGQCTNDCGKNNTIGNCTGKSNF